MRICIMTETYHPVVGGGESQARELTRGLIQRGDSVMVLTRRSNQGFSRVESVDGAKILRLPPTGPSRRKKWGLILTGLWALLRYRDEYDAIIVCGFRILGVPALLAAQLLRKGCVLKADSLGEMSGDFFTAGLGTMGLAPDSPAFSFFLAARNRLFAGAGSFVAISQAIVKEFLAAGIKPDRIRIIPNSVDIQRFKPVTEVERKRVRSGLGLPEDRMITAFSGRLVSYKGLQLLLRVWKELVAEGDPGLLLLVGAGGLDMHNCEGDLRDFVRAHNLESSVTFAGEVTNVEAYLQAADLFVFPSENEAFGISVIEAMAAGLPVISSDAGGLRDLVEDGRTGLCFQSGDAKGLKERISWLLLDPGLRRSLGKAARASAIFHYGNEKVVEKYANLVRDECRE